VASIKPAKRIVIAQNGTRSLTAALRNRIMKNLEVNRESTSAENFPHATNVTGASRIVKKNYAFFSGDLAENAATRLLARHVLQ
jgi:hypothetical protein